jgi:hypothetical protein
MKSASVRLPAEATPLVLAGWFAVLYRGEVRGVFPDRFAAAGYVGAVASDRADATRFQIVGRKAPPA